jgi:hypothetical protein
MGYSLHARMYLGYLRNQDNFVTYPLSIKLLCFFMIYLSNRHLQVPLFLESHMWDNNNLQYHLGGYKIVVIRFLWTHEAQCRAHHGVLRWETRLVLCPQQQLCLRA